MVNSRQKGKVGERNLARKLSELLAPVRRGQQFSGIGGADVVGLQGIHVECKYTNTLRLSQAMQQSVCDAGEDVPIVCHKRSREDWLLTVRLDDILRLLGALNVIVEANQHRPEKSDEEAS